MAPKKNKPADDLFGSIDTGGMFGAVDLGESVDPFGPDVEDTPDPLADLAETGDLAADAGAELNALESGFQARAAQEANRFRQATDSEFWFAVVFATREEKDDFLAQYGLVDLGDKYLLGKDLKRRVKPVKK